MPPAVRIELVKALAGAEYRLASGTSEKLQTGAVVGAFATAKDAIVAAAGGAA